MTRVAVLGYSLSIVGHGCHGMKRVRDTWPYALERESGGGVHVSVYGQARLTCADGPESKTYFWLFTVVDSGIELSGQYVPVDVGDK